MLISALVVWTGVELIWAKKKLQKEHFLLSTYLPEKQYTIEWKEESLWVGERQLNSEHLTLEKLVSPFLVEALLSNESPEFMQTPSESSIHEAIHQRLIAKTKQLPTFTNPLAKYCFTHFILPYELSQKWPPQKLLLLHILTLKPKAFLTETLPDIQFASQLLFQKELNALTWEEAIALFGLTNHNINWLDASALAESLLASRNQTLSQLQNAQTFKFENLNLDSLQKLPLQLDIEQIQASQATYFIWKRMQEATDQMADMTAATEKKATVQKKFHKALEDVFFESEQMKDTIALESFESITIEKQTGRILSWLGNTQKEPSEKHTLGTMMWPFVFAVSLDLPAKPCGQIVAYEKIDSREEPFVYEENGILLPDVLTLCANGHKQIQGGSSWGTWMLSTKMKTVFNQLELGKIDKIDETFAASQALSLQQITELYSLFLNQGKYIPAHIITYPNSEGRDWNLYGKKVLSKKSIRKMNEVFEFSMKDTANPCSSIRVSYNINTPYRIHLGTSDIQHAHWLMLMTPDFITGIRITAPTTQPFKKVIPSQTVLPLAASFLEKLEEYGYKASPIPQARRSGSQWWKDCHYLNLP